jgi:hypothetical protein
MSQEEKGRSESYKLNSHSYRHKNETPSRDSARPNRLMQLRNGVVLQSKPDIDPGNHVHAVLGDGRSSVKVMAHAAIPAPIAVINWPRRIRTTVISSEPMAFSLYCPL